VAVKRTLAAMTFLALVGVGAAVAYQAAARERDYRALLDRGNASLAEGKTFDAIEAYSGAVALRPDSMLPYLRRGETYQLRNDLEAAARDLAKATALDPSATRPLEDLGDVQYQRERYNLAAQTYASLLRLDDRSAIVAYKWALALYRSGNTGDSLTALAQALKLDDGLVDAHYLRGLCLRDEEQPREALAALERAISLSPGHIAAREELADLYASLNRDSDELEQLQLLASLDRDHPARHVAVGMAHARAAHWDLAVLSLGRALERAPDDPAIYEALGRIWLERPREGNDRAYLSKAREALDRVASSPTATSSVLTAFGRALLQNGELAGAEQAFQQASTRYPVEPSAWLEYAAVAERLRHFDAARTALIQYSAVATDDGTVAQRAARIGSLSVRLNDAPGAVVWFQRAAAAAPHDLSLLTTLVEAQIRAGDTAGAKATITRGLELDSTNAQLLSLARRLAVRTAEAG
jgi:tetratricopeptide (TPR) repeat protein